MTKICYEVKRFSPKLRVRIQRANDIIEEYQKYGLTLTLRQIFYQFVSRDWLPNTHKAYKSLGECLEKARMAGLVDWEGIEDRTRHLRALSSWNSPQEILNQTEAAYHTDWWKDQDRRVEVWIEKDALVGVIESVCCQYDVPYFSCRGYSSASEMWRASCRLLEYVQQGQKPLILHLGDHDPSGVNMTHDIKWRLDKFLCPVEVRRIAITIEQVKKYNPPPNPAKMTDPRADRYIKKYGNQSWELDALRPTIIQDLIKEHVEGALIKSRFVAAKKRELRDKASIRDAVKKGMRKPPRKK